MDTNSQSLTDFVVEIPDDDQQHHKVQSQLINEYDPLDSSSFSSGLQNSNGMYHLDKRFEINDSNNMYQSNFGTYTSQSNSLGFATQALNPERKGEQVTQNFSSANQHFSPNQDHVGAFRARFMSYLDVANGNLKSTDGMKALLEAIREESDMALKIEASKMISKTASQDILNEFIQQGGVATYSKWAKNLKNDSSSSEPKLIQEHYLRQELCKNMVLALDKMEVTWNLLKKTKIGKAVNSLLKAQLFDQETNNYLANLVNRWKKMVKDNKQQLQQQQQQVPETTEKPILAKRPLNDSSAYDFLSEEQEQKRRKMNEWNMIQDQMFSKSLNSTGGLDSERSNLLGSLLQGSSQQITRQPPLQVLPAQRPQQPASSLLKQQSSSSLSTPILVSSSSQQQKKKKSLAFLPDHQLEQIKYFKMTDEPSAPALTWEEVQEIQRHLANVPMHMIPTELKNIEMKLDRQKLEEQKNKEQWTKDKLEKMQPMIPYHINVKMVDVGQNYKLAKGQNSQEEVQQKQRERTVFQCLYMNNQIPQNPIRELDEYYAKDEKIQVIDLETIANGYFKEKDDQRFQEQLMALTQELQQLDDAQRMQIAEVIKRDSEQKSHDDTIKLLRQMIDDFKQQNELLKRNAALAQQQQQMMQQQAQLALQQQQLQQQKMGPQPINPKNYRTVPCKNYHGPTGCTRGEFCHFIHAIGFEQKEIPRDVFQKYRNENMRKNYLEEINLVNPQDAQTLANAPFLQIQAYVKQYNDSLAGLAPPPNATQIMTQGIGMNPMMGGAAQMGVNPNMMANQIRPMNVMQPGVMPGMRPPMMAGANPNMMMAQPGNGLVRPAMNAATTMAVNPMMNNPMMLAAAAANMRVRPQGDQTQPGQMNPAMMSQMMQQINPNMLNPAMLNQQLLLQQQMMQQAAAQNPNMFRPGAPFGQMFPLANQGMAPTPASNQTNTQS